MSVPDNLPSPSSPHATRIFSLLQALSRDGSGSGSRSSSSLVEVGHAGIGGGGPRAEAAMKKPPEIEQVRSSLSGQARSRHS